MNHKNVETKTVENIITVQNKTRWKFDAISEKASQLDNIAFSTD